MKEKQKKSKERNKQSDEDKNVSANLYCLINKVTIET